MKISDKELLRLIWKRQIAQAATGVLHNYIGGTNGLCDDGDFWVSASTDIHVCDRGLITEKIGKQQLLARIRKLISKGDLIWVDKDLTFSIANNKMVKELFYSARNFWIVKGVPDKNKNGRLDSIKIDDIKALKDEAIVKLEALLFRE